MLPKPRPIALRVRSDGRTQTVALSPAVDQTAFVSGLAFWASLFGLSVIAGLF